MALSIKTEEADRLARALAKLTGETLTAAVTIALRERLERERKNRESIEPLSIRLLAFASRIHAFYDTRPVSRAEWESAVGDGL